MNQIKAVCRVWTLVIFSGLLIQSVSAIEVTDYAVSISESTDPVQAGSGPGNLTYTVTLSLVEGPQPGGSSQPTAPDFIQLTGSGNAQVMVGMGLHPGVTVDSTVTSDGSVYTGGNWSIFDLGPDNQATLTFVLTLPAGISAFQGSVYLNATLANSEPPDENPINDSAFESTTFLPSIPVVADTAPSHTMLDVPVDTNIVVNFSEAITNVTVTADTFRIWGKQTGFYTGTYSFGSAVFDPADDFKPGEEIVVMLSDEIETRFRAPLVPHQFEFVAAARGCETFAYAPNQSLPAGFAPGIALGDLDGDGDLDAFRAQRDALANAVLLNDGSGTFTNGQALGAADSYGAALGDFNSDGHLDVVVANDLFVNVIPTRILLNNGDGTFTTNQTLGSDNSLSIVVGDVDGDNDLDVITGNTDDQPNRVYFNNGDGSFSAGVQALGSNTTLSVKLGDLDGDGDLDLFAANNGADSDIVYLNDGNGTFTPGQVFTANASFAVALGDLDADGDLDAFVVGTSGPDRIFTNSGAGFFADSGQSLAPAGAFQGRSVALGDMDGDGDLDAFVVNSYQPDTVWINDGSGTFSDSGMRLTAGINNGGRQVALGDLDGDGDLDAYVVGVNGYDDQVYFNQNCFDKDGDSSSDYDEYVAGTDYADASEFFGISDFTILGAGTNEITWNSVTGRLYRVERSYNLSDSNSWVEVYGPVWEASPMVFVNLTKTNPAAYYRLKVELP